MNILKNLEFDRVCKKSTVGIALLAAVMLLPGFVDLPFAAFTGGLATCGILTVYFDMADYAFCKAAADKGEKIGLIADAMAEILKLAYILTPLSGDGYALPLRLAVLVSDAILSRIYRSAFANMVKTGR